MMLKRTCLICSSLFIAAFALLPLTVAGQNQAWELDSAGLLTVEVPGYEEDQQERDAEQLRWMGMILLGILILLGLQTYKRCVKSAQLSQEDIAILRKQRQFMLQELARLDQQYALGNMPESLYFLERRQRKQQLTELTILCKIA